VVTPMATEKETPAARCTTYLPYELHLHLMRYYACLVAA
jgi:hypothetical protein